MQQPTWVSWIPLATAGVAAAAVMLGSAGQQLVDVWKTSKMHRQELQRRIFDAKFKTATEVVILLQSSTSFLRARLAEAEEWTRGDSRYDVLALRQQTVELHAETLATAFKESERALALMEFLFPPTVWLPQYASKPSGELEDAWREFEESRTAFKVALDRLMPEQRATELNLQRQRGEFASGVHEELEHWIRYYEDGVAELRKQLPQLRQLTESYESGIHKAIEVLRYEFRSYER